MWDDPAGWTNFGPDGIKPWLLPAATAAVQWLGGDKSLPGKVATAVKTRDPDDIYSAGAAVVGAIRHADARARNVTASIFPRTKVTSVPVKSSGGTYARPMASLRRVSFRFGRRSRRRSYRVGRRRFRVSRRPGLVSRYAYGTNPQGRTAMRGRVRRVLPRYIAGRSSLQVKYYDFVVRQNTYPAASEGALVDAQYDWPGAVSGQKAVLFPFFNIAVNNTSAGRITDSIRCIRLDLFVVVEAALRVQCADSRITLFTDRDPDSSGAIPLLSDLFDCNSGFVSGFNQLQDTNLYPKVDERNRFGIIWQQNTPLSRGALAADGLSYDATPDSCKRFAKSIYMRNHRVCYRQNTTTGTLDKISSGALYLAIQGGVGATSQYCVGWSIRGRLVYTDM